MRRTTTFLVVEDDPNDVFFVERHFNEAPAHIRFRAVSDGQAAVRYLEGHGNYADRKKYPLPDVILLDLKMSGFDGFDFLKWRAEASRPYDLIPVVVMSSSALKQDIDRAYNLGANSYMVKPTSWQEFRERLKAIGIYWAEHAETPGGPRGG